MRGTIFIGKDFSWEINCRGDGGGEGKECTDVRKKEFHSQKRLFLTYTRNIETITFSQGKTGRYQNLGYYRSHICLNLVFNESSFVTSAIVLHNSLVTSGLSKTSHLNVSSVSNIIMYSFNF